jgi:transcription elongation GreA/GreB family factor
MTNTEGVSKLPKDEIVKMALNGSIVLASQTGLEILNRRILLVQDEIKSTNLRLGESARQDPDLPENTEFKELKTKLQFQLPRKLDDLSIMLAKTVVFEENNPGKICFGTQFEAEVKYPPADVVTGSFILLGPIEAAEKEFAGKVSTVISYMSPIGMALWGKDLASGNSYSFDSPSGKVVCTIR